MLDDENNKNYYKTNALLRFMRFLNLLEPDRNVVSISKIFTWSMLAIIIIVMMVMPNNLDAILGSAGAMVAALLNYSYRRWSQNARDNRHSDYDEITFHPPQRWGNGYNSNTNYSNSEQVSEDEYDVEVKTEEDQREGR